MKIKVIIIALVSCVKVSGQNELVNNAALLYVDEDATLNVNGTFVNQSGGTFSNHGVVSISGDIINNQQMSTYSGKMVFNNPTAQTLGGSAGFLTSHVEIDNAEGVTLNTILRVNGVCTFTNGIVTASDNAAPLWLTADGSVAGTSDASHVNGYVVKEGVGNFSYPVGDGTRYQVVEVNAASNTDGIRVNYVAGNGGNGSFTGATPLLYYNTFEYWDIEPLGTSDGSVTIHWDDYNNMGIGNTSDLRVAHYNGTHWINEDAVGTTGTTATGNVTSHSIDTWSPITLGSVSASSTLPVNWLRMNGAINFQKQSVINWKVNEHQVRYYQIEKSEDARTFAGIGLLQSKGSGDNDYLYTDRDAVKNIAYYRIKQTDYGGKFSYSPVLKLQVQPGPDFSIYPIPFKEGFTIFSPAAQIARLMTVDGKLIKLLQLREGSNYINAGWLHKGIYLLARADAAVQKIIKD